MIFVEKMGPTGACRAGKRRSNFTMTRARREEVEVARGGGDGALGAPSEDAGSRARIMRTQRLFVFCLHLFTYLVQIVVDQLFLGEGFWAKTSTFFHLPAEKERENAIFL